AARRRASAGVRRSTRAREAPRAAGSEAPTRAPKAASRTRPSASGAGRLVRADVLGQALQRRKDRFILRIVGLQLDALALLDHQGYLQHAERIESQTVAEERRRRIELFRIDALHVQRLDNQRCKLACGYRLHVASILLLQTSARRQLGRDAAVQVLDPAVVVLVDLAVSGLVEVDARLV